jgi:hypothetical protein
MPDYPTSLQPSRIRMMQILWAALLVTPFMHALVVAATRHLEPTEPGPPTLFFGAFAGLSLVLGGMSVVLPGVMRRQATRGAMLVSGLEVDDVQRYDPAHEQGFRDAAAAQVERVFRDPQAAAAKAAQVYMTPFIVGMALAEAVANFGLVLAFLGGGLRAAVPFFAVTIALQATRYPTRARVLAAFEEHTGVRFAR